MDEITNITVTENVSLITLRDSQADIRFISYAFDEISKRGVNVDMISQTPPVGNQISLSFTISDEKIRDVLDVCTLLRTKFPQIKTDISSGNDKISVSGDAMRTVPGVAARVFDTLTECETDIRMITTSEVDISILIPHTEYTDIRDHLERMFKIQIHLTETN